MEGLLIYISIANIILLIVGVRTRQINRALRGVEELTGASDLPLLEESIEEDDS